MRDSEEGGGPGCLGAMLGLGLLSLFGGGHEPGGYGEDPPTWAAAPPPEFLEDEDSGGEYGRGWDDEFE